MSHRRALNRGAVLVLLLICALIGAQTASFASEQTHQHSSGHCCGLCHAGPMAFLKSAATLAFAPTKTVAWVAVSYNPGIAHEVPLTAGDSRAPPA
jgi:hypothetical protein